MTRTKRAGLGTYLAPFHGVAEPHQQERIPPGGLRDRRGPPRNRMAVEERALLQAVGDPYSDFMRTRKRLIPYVY